jgi:L-fuculose-phosphate aldolase
VGHYIGGAIPLAEYAPAGSLELAQNAVRSLGRKTHGILLKNHGALAIGRDLRQALAFAELIEQSAKSMVVAHLLGGYDDDPASYRIEA